jgi:hypothetical protein
MKISPRSLCLMCAFAAIGATQLAAQNVELFGGYALASMKPERELDRTNLHGWNTSLTVYPIHRVGFTADFAGTYKTFSPTVVNANGTPVTLTDVRLRQYSFMAGPQVRLLKGERFSSSFRALFGAARGYVEEPSGQPATGYRPFDQTKFAALIGITFDVNLSSHVALRAAPGLYITQFAGETQKNFRLSIGPVFRF